MTVPISAGGSEASSIDFAADTMSYSPPYIPRWLIYITIRSHDAIEHCYYEKTPPTHTPIKIKKKSINPPKQVVNKTTIRPPSTNHHLPLHF